jgi:hypothetical protein
MNTKIGKYKDSIVYVLLGIISTYLLNKEFRGLIEGTLLQIIGLIGFLYFAIKLTKNTIRKVKLNQRFDFLSITTFLTVLSAVYFVTYLNTNERFRSKPILKTYSISNAGAISEEFILRENNDFDMNRYDMMKGNRYLSGKYKLAGDTIVLLDECLNYYYNNINEYYYFDKYFIDSANALIIPINKENELKADSIFMFKIKNYAR